jgi:hypothetical protein
MGGHGLGRQLMQGGISGQGGPGGGSIMIIPSAAAGAASPSRLARMIAKAMYLFIFNSP